MSRDRDHLSHGYRLAADPEESLNCAPRGGGCCATGTDPRSCNLPRHRPLRNIANLGRLHRYRHVHIGGRLRGSRADLRGGRLRRGLDAEEDGH